MTPSFEPTSPADVYARFTDAVFALDAEWRVTYIEEKAERVLEGTEAELLGTKLWEAIPDALVPSFRSRFERAMDDQESVTFEAYHSPLDAWFEVRAVPSETGLSVALHDITDDVHRQKELEHREEALRRAYEIIAEPDRPFIEQIDDLLEVVRETVGTDYATFSCVDGDDYVFEAIDVPADVELEAGATVPVDELPNCKHVVETEQTLVLRDVEAQAPEFADPEWGIACYLGAPVFSGEDAYGTFCFYGTEARSEEFSDWEVTFVELLSSWVSSRLAQRERERFLHDAKSRLEAATEAGAVGTWEWSIPDDEIATGDSFAETFGVDPEAAREGEPLERFLSTIHEDDRDRVEEKIEAALDSCGEFEAEYRVRNADDELRWVSARGHVRCDEDGNPVKFPGALTDITTRKRAAAELEASNERLEQFAYAASHDLQEPLRMVSSYLQLIEDRYADELDAECEEFIDYAVDGAERMRAMIDSLLEYSRIETRGDPFEPVDLEAVVDDVRTDCQLQIGGSGAEITTEDLPTVVGDADQLRQLFQNLLDNAIEYSGDEPPRVELSVTRDGSEWIVSVRDEGIGVDPDDQQRIFEVFQRLHTHDEHAGTGIGLALCERIVERHGGEIWLESEPGEGSTFSVTLPAADDRAVEGSDRGEQH
ncbi:ATP-binding protein [Haloterrigena salinisoli]|uniref:ATP-binding protein n=1 Tax=Haloterrigena salinisoli TaxID=3132747 RepID=UPI0030D08D65